MVSLNLELFPQQLDLEKVKEIMSSDVKNPTVDKLIFAETRKTSKTPRKVFPCYPVAYEEADHALVMAVAQCAGTRFFFGYVKMPEEDIGVKCRFWDAPPDEDQMDADPLPEAPAEESEEKDEEAPPQ